MAKETKEFDCVEMKRRIQEEIYRETQSMTDEEFIDYIHACIRESEFADFLDLPSSDRPSA